MNNFCVHCGNKLSGEKYCPSCGASVNETSHDEHTNNIKKQTNARKSSRNSLFVIVMIIINIISIIIFLKLGRYVYSTYYNSNKNNTSITDSVDKTNKSVSKSKSVTITGQWKDLNNRNGIYELEFFSDGTYKSNQSNYAGTYSADGNRLRLDGILMEDLIYTFQIDGDTLTLYDDKDKGRKYTKVN